MSEDLYDLIGNKVESTAEWRRLKAREFANDQRNARAADQLERLAAQVDALDGSQIHKEINDLQDRLCDVIESDGSYEHWATINDAVSENLRSVGFHGDAGTGEEFLEWYRDLLQEELQDLLDAKTPIPSLDEQVANDPAVKAAKQAYDEAYAKAYAEARKRL